MRDTIFTRNAEATGLRAYRHVKGTTLTVGHVNVRLTESHDMEFVAYDPTFDQIGIYGSLDEARDAVSNLGADTRRTVHLHEGSARNGRWLYASYRRDVHEDYDHLSRPDDWRHVETLEGRDGYETGIAPRLQRRSRMHWVDFVKFLDEHGFIIYGPEHLVPPEPT